MTPTIRLMSYNIRACLGTDGVRSIERIAAVIAAEQPDIVALQEVDFSRIRSDEVDQAERLADILRAKAIPGPSFSDGRGSYGNAILSRHPAVRVHHDRLPYRSGTEPRSAMWVRIDHPTGPVHVINTHLTFWRRDRPAQIHELLGLNWLARGDPRVPAVLCGDLNCSPRDSGFRQLLTPLRDALAYGGGRPPATWPTRRPFRRLDHILVPPGVTVSAARTVCNSVSRIASDHYPVVADFRL